MVIPVGDLAQHVLAKICDFTQNGYTIYDDVAKKAIPGTEKFGNLVDANKIVPLTVLEQSSLADMTAEFFTSCYAGVLMLQAMGPGGYMYEGVDRHTILGASGDPSVAGLGFRYDTDDRWSLPNPTGLQGVFEAYCPLHYHDMREATGALAKRKFGNGDVYNSNTPGAWSHSPKVRGSANPYTEQFKECVALQAQYIYDTYGKFPTTVPSIFVLTYVQAQHLDLDFYDHYFKPGAYLDTHKVHMKRWH